MRTCGQCPKCGHYGSDCHCPPAKPSTLLELLERAESFITGFEGDETQEEPVDGLLEEMRAALARKAPTLGLVIKGGALQGVVSDDPAGATALLKGIVLIDYDDGEAADEEDETVHEIEQFPGEKHSYKKRASVRDWGVDEAGFDFPALLKAVDERNASEESDDAKPSE